MGVFDRLSLPKGKRLREHEGGTGQQEKKQVVIPPVGQRKPGVFSRLQGIQEDIISSKRERIPGRAKQQHRNAQEGQTKSVNSKVARGWNDRSRANVKDAKQKHQVEKRTPQGDVSNTERENQWGGPQGSAQAHGHISRGSQVDAKDIEKLQVSVASGEAVVGTVSAEGCATDGQEQLNTFLKTNDSAIAKYWHALKWDDTVASRDAVEEGGGASLLKTVNGQQHSA